MNKQLQPSGYFQNLSRLKQSRRFALLPEAVTSRPLEAGPQLHTRLSWTLAPLRPDQWEIVNHPAKVKVVCNGRRWGKTTMGGTLAAIAAAQGAKVLWTAPTYKNTRPLWRWVESVCGPFVADGVEVSRSERTVSFPNGGFLALYSADNPTAIRGEWFHFAIVDEAPLIEEETWTDVIQPTLADAEGTALLIGTPKGRNWYYREWTKAKADGKYSAAWTAPTNANPMPTIQKAFELAKERMSERTFRQEWLAEFIDDGGGVFQKVREVATEAPAEADANHTIVAGIDWAGGGADATVVTIIDATAKREIAKERFTGLNWGMAEARVEAALRKYGVQVALGEDNGMGGPLNNNLRRKNVRVRDFHTSNASKAELIEGLVMAIERGEVRILNDRTTIDELEAFEATRLPGGEVRYAAPAGFHDDHVISLALAWRAASARRFEFG